MKIKNSVPSLGLGALSKIYMILACACTALRAFQLFFHIEPETGFNVGSGLIMAILYVLVLGGCLAFSVVSFLSKESKEFDIEGVKSDKASAISFAFAATLLIDWLTCVFGRHSRTRKIVRPHGRILFWISFCSCFD